MPPDDMISVQQLLRLIGTEVAPVLMDVCIDEDFAADPRLIPTATRVAFSAMDEVSLAAGQRHVVVICQKGLKLSQGAAAMLRGRGIPAAALAGGNHAWRDAGMPLIPFNLIPKRCAGGGTVWVAPRRPEVDGMACAWLIRRFVDRDARFLFVGPAEVPAVAERFDATPIGVADVFWNGQGGMCTFERMLDALCLDTEPLRRLAAIVRGAVNGPPDGTPQSAGLLAASHGLSWQFRDDLKLLEAGMCLLDAFYRWCRDAREGRHV